MGVKSNPTDATANWKSRFGASSANYTRGVQAFQGDPTKLAAAAADRWVSGVQNARGTFVSKLQAVPAGYWAQRAASIGANNLSAGATKGEAKMSAFMTTFLPRLDQIISSAPQRGDFAANMNRFQAIATALHNAKGSF